MDEPFGSLDPLTRVALQNELARIHRASGKTIVLVTHDIDEALRLATRGPDSHAHRSAAGVARDHCRRAHLRGHQHRHRSHCVNGGRQDPGLAHHRWAQWLQYRVYPARRGTGGPAGHRHRSHLRAPESVLRPLAVRSSVSEYACLVHCFTIIRASMKNITVRADECLIETARVPGTPHRTAFWAMAVRVRAATERRR